MPCPYTTCFGGNIVVFECYIPFVSQYGVFCRYFKVRAGIVYPHEGVPVYSYCDGTTFFVEPVMPNAEADGR
jgi:hypothetical protein